jgi:hypothetical protein
MEKKKVPEPLEREQRICFGIAYFTSEKDAELYAADVKRRGCTYNGGYFDGMVCGRAPEFDYERSGRKLYAVTE